MSFGRVEVRKDGVGFCYQGSWIVVNVNQDELRIAEEISYEVAIGSQLGKIQIVIKNGKAYVESPLGKHELSNPTEIINAIRKINEEIVKSKNKDLYERILKIIGSS
ncbi:hypothetical protein SJAV_01150 [Sulfurisphaera javensis]|uniref:Uncharacterized protein n=1 Tax=Sulfurisphaera javensis TaxID=2049879 RepID=A0AAT9GMY1_9CREN